MAIFLDSDWFAEVLECASALPQTTGADLDIYFEVSKTKDAVSHPKAGKVIHFTAELKSGQLVKLEEGKASSPEVKVRSEFLDLQAAFFAELAPEAGFMANRIKLDGKYQKVMYDLRPFWASKSWQGFWEKAQAATQAAK